MAFIITPDDPPRMRAQLDRFFATLGQGVSADVEARSRRGQIETLQVMSGAQRARLGITRDRVVASMFRDRPGL